MASDLPSGSLWNSESFPHFDNIPEEHDTDNIDHHTAFIGEIKRDASLGRLTLMVTDGKVASEKNIPVAFYDHSNGAVWSPLAKVGHTVVILYPETKKHHFLDGQEGFRINEEDMKHVRIFPYDRMGLLTASDVFFSITTKPKQCQNCAVPELTPWNPNYVPDPSEKDKKLLACGRCRVIKYCNKECQTAHWGQHKKYCRQLADVQWFTRKDWDKVASTADGKPVLFQFE
ncbi:hypothetical protein BJ508DRAFT_357920 [Ascobolus immersus RN42]|uniref:MYND-type domain-containing protein n=1 Tax=Ascobolus immersus RN42 TaxID=1160509 RepID=A0A3N4IRJ2_ASCIM|nr:hypothetical protein BJ508DRAFT_357920 [Ascobolus immersus RN42]